ncbi:hypothetical protein [Sphingomonas sp.]|uniref:hypothetical protein n=1 Tax=Sphingomonas sp. TaxID=28214 RepID=UPI0028A7434E|nr:hypothetical protein [Sphingomonas sp.]
MKMIAKKAFRYGDRQLVAGDPFETKTDRDAALLRAIRRADPADDEEAPAPSPTPSPTPTEDPDPKPPAGGKVRSGRGTYQRRDMRAKG